MNSLPEIGTTMYSVHEHCYYIPGRAAPLVEYCVCSGKVERYRHGGYTEIIVVGNSPNGYTTPYPCKSSDIGKKVFYTEEEAVVLAEQMADEYDRRWLFLGHGIYKPMRRPWRKEET